MKDIPSKGGSISPNKSHNTIRSIKEKQVIHIRILLINQIQIRFNQSKIIKKTLILQETNI